LIFPAFLFSGFVQLSAQTSLNGLYQNYNAFQTTQDNELIAGRNRLRLQLNSAISPGNLFAEVDLIQRYNEDTPIEIQLRELYADLYFDQSDLRIGLQKIIWGRAAGGFIADILSPVDLREFLTQDPDDLRIGLTALNFTRYFGANSLQIVVSPLFQPDLLPPSDSRWFPIPDIPSPLPIRYQDAQFENNLSDVQLALRYGYRSRPSFDLDLYLMSWNHPMPAYAININFLNLPDLASVDLRETFNQSLMTGFSSAIRIGNNFTLNFESLYVHQRLFTFLPVSAELLESSLTSIQSAFQLLQEFELRDDGYLIKKPWLNSMAGFQTEQFGVTINAQAYLEWVMDYEDRLLPDRLFPYASVLLNKPFLRERLQSVLLARYNVNSEDFWIQLQGIYELDDGIEIALGSNLFGGRETSPFYGHFTFNQFKENSFIFSKVAIYF
jgi:hypothetical protein